MVTSNSIATNKLYNLCDRTWIAKNLLLIMFCIRHYGWTWLSIALLVDTGFQCTDDNGMTAWSNAGAAAVGWYPLSCPKELTFSWGRTKVSLRPLCYKFLPYAAWKFIQNVRCLWYAHIRVLQLTCNDEQPYWIYWFSLLNTTLNVLAPAISMASVTTTTQHLKSDKMSLC